MPQGRQRPASGEDMSQEKQKGPDPVNDSHPVAPEGPEGRTDCKGLDEHHTRIWKGEGLG